VQQTAAAAAAAAAATAYLRILRRSPHQLARPGLAAAAPLACAVRSRSPCSAGSASRFPQERRMHKLTPTDV